MKTSKASSCPSVSPTSRSILAGCQEGTVELEEWYRSADGRNDWHGRCVDRTDGAEKQFAINVDSVWKPSSSD